MMNDTQVTQDVADLKQNGMDTVDGASPLIVEKLHTSAGEASGHTSHGEKSHGQNSNDKQPVAPADEKPEKLGSEKSKQRPAFNSSPTALQDLFLNGLRRENIDVVVYFTDGTQERGVVRGFDTFTLLVENRTSGKPQLIYKHAITRIFPVRTPSDLNDRKK